ncbi:MAG: hypothetical protein OXI71_18575 [Gemmatimonadota bacterium]|nr:hypothetical protein [Gemmatimonadota bacterium]
MTGSRIPGPARLAMIVLGSTLALSVWGVPGAMAQTLVPERIGTAELQLSENGSIALLADEITACTIDSHEVRIHCVDRAGTTVGIFGREGEGPGEFRRLTRLGGGSEGTVGALDIGAFRFSVFEANGTRVADVPLLDLAFPLHPVGRFGETVSILGFSTVDPYVVLEGAGSGRLYTLDEVAIASGEVVRKVDLPPVDAEVECGEIHYGFPDPAGGWVFVACEGHLVFVAEDGATTVIQAPTYTGELAGERDIAERSESLSSFNRVVARSGAGGAVDPTELEGYRTTPKNYHLLSGQQKFDEEGRLWIATQRDRDEFSYIDVYSPGDATYFGSVRIDGRLQGFDLVGATLAVVVERQITPDDPDGIPDRAVDWYDVGEWR